MMITLQPTIKPFALSDMNTKIDTDGSTNVIQKTPIKLVLKVSSSNEPTAHNTEHTSMGIRREAMPQRLPQEALGYACGGA